MLCKGTHAHIKSNKIMWMHEARDLLRYTMYSCLQYISKCNNCHAYSNLRLNVTSSCWNCPFVFIIDIPNGDIGNLSAVAMLVSKHWPTINWYNFNDKSTILDTLTESWSWFIGNSSLTDLIKSVIKTECVSCVCVRIFII